MKKISIVGKGNKKEEKKLDFSMLVTILILLSMGLVMVASASSYYALSTSGNSTALLQRQLMLAIVGVIAMLFISKIDYTKYKKASYIFYIISILLLIAVLTPLGVSRNGAKRWLGFGESFTFQPSEIMKIALVMATAAYISTNPKKLNNIKGYFIPFLLLMAVVVVMYLQKHMSGTIVMGVASISIIFASGINIKPKYVIAVIMLILVVGGAFIVTDEFRLKRIFSFLNPEENIKDGNWQAAQSLYAIGSGGIFGRGIGQSREKYLWLPEAQNDFIFSVLGEEFGLVGTVTVLSVFVFFIYRGYKIAITCNDLFGSLIATGITSVFALQIFVNVAVVTCTMPVTGMPLPFFSYGGTALLINLCAMGLLLSVSRNCKND
ncbi:stage V sporulation protein E [Clostridium sp. CAG:921]|nr:stage V sporulation protein E [Clostridium sp. CAG:921]